MKRKLFVLLAAIFFIAWYLPVSLPQTEPTIGYSTVPDLDADYLISKKISQGERLYESFSILYPPGRFFVQGLLFKLIQPSFWVLWAYHGSMMSLFFPVGLFLVTFSFFYIQFYTFFEKRFVNLRAPLAILFGLAASLIYLLFIKTAQEIHVISALFLIVLSTGWKNEIKNLLLGILLGLAFLFRVDGGIILLIALVIGLGSEIRNPTLTIQKNFSLIIGFLVIWIPTVVLLILHGSLINFLYDTVILGLIIQPKFMSLPIPPNELRLVWLTTLIYLISAGVSIFSEAKQFSHHEKDLKILALSMVLSYVSALGRSDEAHLWYGLVWLPIVLLYIGYRIFAGISKREELLSVKSILTAILVLGYGWLILWLKSPFFFLVSLPLFIICIDKLKVKIFSFLLFTTLAALLIFHSLSYLKLLYAPLTVPSKLLFSQSWITTEEGEIGGAKLPTVEAEILQKIRADIPPSETYLFIFPKNILLTEYFQLKHPTRYIILTNERSEKTENEVIHDLINTQTKYFLVFPTAAKLREGIVWEWILQHTEVLKEYEFPEEKAELRILKNSNYSK